MTSARIASLAGLLLVAACTSSGTGSVGPSGTQPLQDNDTLVSVSAKQTTTLFSQSSGSADNQIAPVFKICSQTSNTQVAEIWLFPSKGALGDSHPDVKQLPLQPGACVFANAGHVEARLPEAVVRSTNWLEERAESLRKSEDTTGASAALLAEYEQRQGQDPEAWLIITPIVEWSSATPEDHHQMADQ